VGITEDALFTGKGSVNVVHQFGETVEGGFLNHFMLTQFFRKFSREQDNARALLILNHHTVAHWTSIASKLGTNINVLQESGKLIVIDLLKDIYEKLKTNPTRSASANDHVDLQNLFTRCHQTVEDFRKTGSRRILVIIDDLGGILAANGGSAEATFQDSEKNLLQFLVKLKALSVQCHEDNSCAVTITCLVNSPELSTDSLELSRFAKTVSQVLPSVLFEVAPLSTGFSSNVTGFLKVVYKPRKSDCTNKVVEKAFMKNYHFKLDSNCA
ncbi:Elongator complex protein 6, partial [Orchesella cincta]